MHIFLLRFSDILKLTAKKIAWLLKRKIRKFSTKIGSFVGEWRFRESEIVGNVPLRLAIAARARMRLRLRTRGGRQPAKLVSRWRSRSSQSEKWSSCGSCLRSSFTQFSQPKPYLSLWFVIVIRILASCSLLPLLAAFFPDQELRIPTLRYLRQRNGIAAALDRGPSQHSRRALVIPTRGIPTWWKRLSILSGREDPLCWCLKFYSSRFTFNDSTSTGKIFYKGFVGSTNFQFATWIFKLSIGPVSLRPRDELTRPRYVNR